MMLEKTSRTTHIFSALNLNLPSPLEKLSSDLLTEKNVQLYVKRDELIHPQLTGNKWRKLKYNLLQARHENKKTLLTFGGAYSNHIHALAAAGHLLGFETIGVIRGERAPVLSPTLIYAQSQGMKLHFVSRTDYRNKTDKKFIQTLEKTYGEFYLVPEGGANALAVKGVEEVADEIIQALPKTNYICTACGTGGTLAGIISGIRAVESYNIQAIGFPVLKNAHWMKDEVLNFLTEDKCNDDWTLELDYHFGGYAKYNAELINFIKQFEKDFSIPIEPIYTAKMFFGLFDMIKNNRFSRGSIIVAIHTGGLQGLAGIPELAESESE